MMAIATFHSHPSTQYQLEKGVTPIDTTNRNTYFEYKPKDVIVLEGFLAIFEDIKLIFQMMIEEIKNLFRDKDNKNYYNNLDGGQVFFIPGLGDPGIWGQIAKRKLQKAGATFNVCVCKHQNNGNQSTEKTFTAVYKLVNAYCTNNPSKPIVLAGVSLGGRMAHMIELQLRIDHPNTPVLIYAMAPAFASQFCTDMDNNAPCLTGAVLDRSLIEAFKVGSSTTTSLIKDINAPLAGNVAPRTFHAVKASNDDLIDGANAFANITNQTGLTYQRYVAHRCSHLGILGVASDHMNKTIVDFLSRAQ